MKYVGIGIGVLVLLLGLGWVIQGNDFFMYKVFAPKYEQVRRDTFEQSKAFNQGMIQELQNMRFEYARQTDPAAKASMSAIILHRAADYNMDDPRVPADLRSFVKKLRDERTTEAQ